MSRTYKDRGYEHRWPQERWDFDRDEDNPYLKKAGVKTKKKKVQNQMALSLQKM